jgi:hypothetical protein
MVMEAPQGATPQSARRAVIRAAVVYTPLFAASLALTVVSAIGVINAGIVVTIIVGGISFLFGYQSIQALRDIGAELTITQGGIARRWSKMDLFITRSHYISVNRNIFRLPVEDWYGLAEDDVVIITHYPHTGTVATIEKVDHAPRKPESRKR